MSPLNLTAAARIVGVSRSTIARAVRSSKLSTTTNDTGDRCVDMSELIRVFGPLKHVAISDNQPMSSHDIVTDPLVDLLREQLKLALAREQQALDREQQAQERETYLLSLLQAEQQARHELEQRLLPGPPHRPAVVGNIRLWVLLVILLLALVLLVVSHHAG
jgi:hypothetical protein